MTANQVTRLHQPGWMQSLCRITYRNDGLEFKQFGIIQSTAPGGEYVTIRFPFKELYLRAEELVFVERVNQLAMADWTNYHTLYLPEDDLLVDGRMPEFPVE